MTENRPPDMTTRWGYQARRLQTFCGATPAFAHSATRLELTSAVPVAEEASWWHSSLTILERLSADHPPLAHWLRCAQHDEEDVPASPLETGWQALQTALGCPVYPSAATRGDPSDSPLHLVMYFACPYGNFTQLSFRLISTWLRWGHAACQRERITLNRGTLLHWFADFDKLPTLLPEPALMSMHHRLWQQGIAWEWLGEGRTRIGEGARQQVITGVPTELPLNAPEVWHVPIYTVTGSVGKTTTARLLSQLLQDSGNTLALAASDGAWIGRQQVMEGDCIGGVTARALLKSPLVQAAVFEQGRGGIVKQGVPYARSDMGILLNVQQVHLGLDGIETVEQMANTKATGLQPARLWVLNHDDEQCVRVARRHLPEQTLWFSVSAPEGMLEGLSRVSLAALGVERDAAGAPQAMTVWQAGQALERWSLEGVAPYQGLLGDKTLEELLAAVAAAYFGPLKLTGTPWPDRLRRLQLDGANHVFRTSVHRQGNAVFVLDKAGELASLHILAEAVEELALREGCDHRILVLCRSAGEVPERHVESIQLLYEMTHEAVCFDRPDSYTSKSALPMYTPGSIPVLLRDEWTRVNAATGLQKPVTIADDWEHAEAHLRQRLQELPGRTLVLINQPSTASAGLNHKILAFATAGLNDVSAGAGIETHAND